jgi:hypothetical protein
MILYFAKCYQKLKFIIRADKIPTYNPTDHKINIIMTKQKINCTRTALLAAKQTRMRNFYRQQQLTNDSNLSKLLAKFKDYITLKFFMVDLKTLFN